jgi:hypothetical protein
MSSRFLFAADGEDPGSGDIDVSRFDDDDLPVAVPESCSDQSISSSGSCLI